MQYVWHDKWPWQTTVVSLRCSFLKIICHNLLFGCLVPKGAVAPWGLKVMHLITFFLNSASTSDIVKVDCHSERILGARLNAKSGTVIGLNEECWTILFRVPNKHLRRTKLAFGSWTKSLDTENTNIILKKDKHTDEEKSISNATDKILRK